MASAVADHSTKQAQDQIMTLALSRFAFHGYAAPGSDALGNIVQAALASVGPDELRRPETIGPAALGKIDQLVMGSVEAGRPRNAYSAEAARAELAAGNGHARHGLGSGLADGRPGSSARYRDLGGDDGRKGGSSAEAAGVTVPAEFMRSYAGAGLGRGTVQTFAEIGLQRGVYDAYRQEGFSRQDIADAASTTKALGWKNDRQAFDDVQRSSRPERAAIVEIDREKDAEKRQTLIEQKRKALDIDHKPQEAQDRWNRNIDRVQQRGNEIVQEHGVGVGSKHQDATLKGERAQEHGKPATVKLRVAKLEASKAQGGAAEASAREDDFKVPSKPPPSNKGTEAKLSSSGPKIV